MSRAHLLPELAKTPGTLVMSGRAAALLLLLLLLQSDAPESAEHRRISTRLEKHRPDEIY